MSAIFLVTEEQAYVGLLQALLPRDVQSQLEFVARGGSSQAIAFFRSVVAVDGYPAILLIDTHTVDASLIEEQREHIENLIFVDRPHKILLAVPSLEEIFFCDKKLLEKMLGRGFSDLEWELGRQNPKLFLQHLKGESFELTSLVEGLSKREREKLSKHPLLREIIAFVREL